MHRSIIALTATVIAATAATAHEGVKDPAVMARMHAMSEIGDATKVLGQMAKGAAPFDATAAQSAADAIAREAARIPALFETRADDPKSEALPAIWERFEDFSALALDLERAASVEIATPKTRSGRRSRGSGPPARPATRTTANRVKAKRRPDCFPPLSSPGSCLAPSAPPRHCRAGIERGTEAWRYISEKTRWGRTRSLSAFRRSGAAWASW